MRDTISNLHGELVLGKNIGGIRPDHTTLDAKIDTLAIDGTSGKVLNRVSIAPLDVNKIGTSDYLIKKGVLVVQNGDLRVIAIPDGNKDQKGYVFLPVEEKIGDKVKLLPPELWATAFLHNLDSLTTSEQQQQAAKFLADLTAKTSKRKDEGSSPAKTTPEEPVAQWAKVYNRSKNGPFVPSSASIEPQAQKARVIHLPKNWPPTEDVQPHAEPPIHKASLPLNTPLKAVVEPSSQVVAPPTIIEENAVGTWPAINIDSLPPARLNSIPFVREDRKTLVSGPDGRSAVDGSLNAKYILQGPAGQFTIGPENSGFDVAIKLKGLGETIKIGVAADQEGNPHCVVKNLGNGMVQRLNFLAPGQQVNLSKGVQDHIGIVFLPTSYRLPNGNIISIRQELDNDMKPQIIVEVYEEIKRR